MFWPTNNTIDGCLNQCAAFGYPAAGLEFGNQCCKRIDPLVFWQAADRNKSAAISLTSPQMGQPMARIQVVSFLARETLTIGVEEKAS
jgi:hypothetical protein